MTSNQTQHAPVFSQKEPVVNLALEVGVATLFRLVLSTARRFAYPFAPVLSRGLGVPLTAGTALIAANQATAVVGLFFGPVSDRFGYRVMMLAGLGMLSAGMLAAGFFPFYVVVLVGLFLGGLGKSVFDPALQAYVSERVPYHRRGLVIGLLEVSWAGSALLGIPLVALLIDKLGWRSPFWVLGGLGLLGIVVLRLLIADKNHSRVRQPQTGGLGKSWLRLVQERAALGALGYAFLVSMANDNLFVIYGAWLEKRFSLSIMALGLGASVIGFAELSGETLTAVLADRIGLKRSVLAGISACVICYALLPLLAQTLSLALVGLFIVFLTFEFMIVASTSLFTELLPASRATMMAGYFAAAGIGRVAGALIGGPIWLAGGIQATALVSAAINGLALVCLIWGLRGWRRFCEDA
ncbi:MAG: MFS transporter [Desulfobacterales bacterium]|nr:MAG: MFS transporter [Desulfobacterales bacterium]